MNNDFWANAEILDTYTDADAIDDGVLVNTTAENVYFNGKIINRITANAHFNAHLVTETDRDIQEIMQDISINARKSDNGCDVWGVYEKSDLVFWLVPNEIHGYTLMMPDDY